MMMLTGISSGCRWSSDSPFLSEFDDETVVVDEYIRTIPISNG